MIKTAVIGASGYIGRHLWQSYRSKFPDCVGTTFSANQSELVHFDIRNPDIASLRLIESGHQAVIIASAKPNVAFCEKNPNDAYAVNVHGTLEAIRQLDRIGIPVIFLSSDYVFEGISGPYNDTDPVNPTTDYGRHKAHVERKLPELADRFLIFRLSKIYGTQKNDKTLLDEMASILASGSAINAAADQKFCPTHIDDVVKAVHYLQGCQTKGTFNVCSPEGRSRYEIAIALAQAMHVDMRLIKAISLHTLPSMSSRPLDTRMNASEVLRNVGLEFTPLDKSIKEVAALWTTSTDGITLIQSPNKY